MAIGYCIRGQQPPAIGMFGTRVNLKLTNSVLEDLTLLFATTDTTAPGSTAKFGFNTFVLKTAPLDCSSSASNRSVLFEDNIVSGPLLTAVIQGSNCTFTGNVLLPQPTAPSGNIVADPPVR